jgi:hypothetical protein
MSQLSGTFGALSDQVLKTIVDFTKEGLDELDLVHPKLFKQKSTTRKFERMQSIAPFGAVVAKPEGTEYDFDVIQPGYSKDITAVEYGLGFEHTETAMEDDDFEVLAQHSRWLGFSARVLQETKAAAVLNNGFTTQTTADGEPLFDTAHPLKRGGSSRNRLSTDSDLSMGAIATMRSDMRTQTKLESGQLVRPSKDVYLWCHPDKEWLAHRLVMSAGLPQTADNDTNPAKDLMNITVLAWEYLEDTGAWGFIAKKTSSHGLVQVNRVKPKLNPTGVDHRTGNRIITIRFRQHWDAFDYRNTAGTPGA